MKKSLFASAVILTMMMGSPSGFGAVQTWNGGAGNMDFNNAGNWSGAGPQSGDDMTFTAAGVYQPSNIINVTANCTVHKIVLSRNTTLTFNIANGVTLTFDNVAGNESIYVTAGQTVAYEVSSTGTGTISLNGSFTVQNDGTGGLLVSTPIVSTAGGGPFVSFEGTESMTISGNISGDCAVWFIMTANDDVVTMSGTNTYTGATMLLSGTAKLMNTSAFGTASDAMGLRMLNGPVLEIGVAINAANWVPGIYVSNHGTIKVSAPGTVIDNEITIDNSTLNIIGNESLSITGVIKNGGGAGDLTVNMDAPDDVVTSSGANTYTGATTVNGGTMVFNGVNTGVSSVTVNNAGTILAGTGTIPGTVTMNNGTILAPGGNGGADVGTLTISDLLTLNGESKYRVTITGGTTDKITAGNNIVATGSTPNIEIQSGYDIFGLAIPAVIMDIAGAYTAFDESGLPAGWDIDNAKVGNLIRIIATGAAPSGPSAGVPTLDEWGMIVLSLMFAVLGIMHMRKRHERNAH